MPKLRSASSGVIPPVPHAPAAALRRDAWREMAAGYGVLLLCIAGARALGDFGPWFGVKATLLFAAGCACVRLGLAQHAPHTRFGAANRLTLLRLALIALLGALFGEAPAEPHALAWGVVLLATLTAVLDTFDGPLARAAGMASPFGARFDMESDALLVLVLSVLVYSFDKAGAWVLAAGLMRYAFVAAASMWPWLAAPLAPALRRKTVCVVQITSLIVCLGPIIARPWSTAIAAASLALLAGSFIADIVALWRQQQRAPNEGNE